MFGRAFIPPNVLIQGALRSIKEFSLANAPVDVKPATISTVHPLQWVSPLPGWLKVNWDASFQKIKGWMGFGVVVRDEEGRLVATLCKTLLGNLDPPVAKAWGALMAIRMCKELGFMNVHFDSDAQVVINAVNSWEVDWSKEGLLVADIKRELEGIPQWRMRFVRREGNRTAHVLSKEATTSLIDKRWLSESPDCMKDLVLVELNALSR